jgi:S-DNA-T family DNA segregation ATPase FtsK/SpoIIIE
LTAVNDVGVRLKIKQNFTLVYTLEQSKLDDYASILGNCRGKIPAKYKGRGMFKSDKIYEFQTASITDGDTQTFLENFITTHSGDITRAAKEIPSLPVLVNYEAIKSDIDISTTSVVGINKENLTVEKYNFEKNVINLISSIEIGNTYNFVNSLINEITYQHTYEIIFVNTTEQPFDNPFLEGRTCKSDYDKVPNVLSGYVDQVYSIYESDKYDNSLIKEQKKYMVFIYGVYDFISKLSPEAILNFNNLVTKASHLGVVSFVLIDNPDVLRNFAYETWFKAGADLSRGIWIGSDFSNQTLFKISSFEKDNPNISNQFGYNIQSSKGSKMKVLEEFYVNKN